MSSAETEYSERLAARRATAQRLGRLERRISNSRLGVFLVGVAVALVGFDTSMWSPWWVVVPLAVFMALVLVHDRVITARVRGDRAVTFYEHGVARVQDAWSDRGDPGERFVDATHPYASDLDLFGAGSLFQLLCTARTRSGEETLANWLRAPAAIEEVRARQRAVAELCPRLDLREELALLGADVRAGLDADALATWGGNAPLLTSPLLRPSAAALVVLLAVAVLFWLVGGAGPLPVAVVLAVEAVFVLPLRRRVAQVLHAAQHPDRDLDLLGQLLACLEREHFEAPRLQALRAALDTAGEPPSRRIARLHRLIHLLDARKNQLFAPLSAPLLWGTQIALAIEAWRALTGPSIGHWVSAVGEFEALCALAGYAYEHPDDPFPEMVAEGPCFEADGLGHPLIPAARCVRNDVSLGGALRLLVVSGSNMSGKSTLLRSVGTAAVLAQAGAPVRARRLRLSALQVGASIRILDSLQTGTSHFYAEITRLRQLMDLTQSRLSLLFLLDEILHGTNSHDRGIGAEALMRGFVARGAIGLVTTHDLALARVAAALAPRAANVHFEDHLEAGQMTFDYRMRHGVVEKSNAVALMRAVGLEV